MITHADLHYALIKHIVDVGYAPSNATLAAQFGTSEAAVVTALHALQEYHGVVLHPHEPKVWVIHPFSLAPTNFHIQSAHGQWWGTCAWCSLGAAALLQTDLTISTSIGAEGKPVVIRIENGDLVTDELLIHFPIPMQRAWDNVIYTCSTMLVFQDEEEIRDWSARHNIPMGDTQPIQKIWEFSKQWYGDHLNPNWKKWTAEEAKAMFKAFDLNHAIWDLETSADRF